MRVIKIKKINWGQFGKRTISIRCDRFVNGKALVEITETDSSGNRHYPGQYLINKKNLTESDRHQFAWGSAYIIDINDEDIFEPYNPNDTYTYDKHLLTDTIQNIRVERTDEEIAEIRAILKQARDRLKPHAV